MQDSPHRVVEVVHLSDLVGVMIGVAHVADEDRMHVLDVSDRTFVEHDVPIEVDTFVEGLGRRGGCRGAWPSAGLWSCAVWVFAVMRAPVLLMGSTLRDPIPKRNTIASAR